jgi:glycogen synthase
VRVALVATHYPPDNGGGIGTYSELLAEGLAASGHGIIVFAKSGSGEDSIEHRNGVEIRRYRQRNLPRLEGRFPGWWWGRFIGRKVLAEHKRMPFDAVEFPNWEAPGHWWGKRRAGLGSVTRIHTPYFETLEMSRKAPTAGDQFVCDLEQRAVSKSRILTASTRFHADSVAAKYGINPSRIRILPLGINCGPEPELHEKSGPLEILYVSRMEARKGTQTLLEAVPQVVARYPGCKFTLIGGDRPHAPGGKPFEAWFRESFPDNHAHVEFRGHVSSAELEASYRSCDIFCVPSNYESFGLIFVEAMAHGKPVVACSGGGIPEVVAHSHTGFLSEPRDSSALAENIVLLCKDRALRMQMGKAARLDVVARFSRERMVRDTIAVYEQAGL